jgi:hypothetical protein
MNTKRGLKTRGMALVATTLVFALARGAAGA